MKKRIHWLIALICLTTVLACAQETNLVKNRFELRLAYTLQRPFYTPKIGALLYVKNDFRLRHAADFSVRYYIFERFFTAYQIGYSLQGGGYRAQHTNANYLTNTLLIGTNASHTRKVVFETSIGLTFNTLLSAQFQNTTISSREIANSYFHKHHLSVPIALGLKSKMGTDTWLGVQTSGSLSRNVSAETTTEALQLVFPAFTIYFTKMIP